MFENNDKIQLIEDYPLKEKPLISVVVPAFNTPPQYLYPFVYSVVGQFYDNWELIIANASTNKAAKYKINDLKGIDQRIKVIEINNEGIASNTNAAIEHSSGEFIAFMDHDDVLTIDALQEIAKAINQNPNVGLIYSDEDKLAEDGSRFGGPHFKPDWSPDLLTHVNYVTHLTVIKKNLIKEVGGLDTEKDGAQDYDLILKVTDLKPEIIHIPKILYHWREAKKSTAQSIANKPYIKKAGEKALADHYKRIGVKVDVTALPDKPGFYKVTYRTHTKPLIVIPLFASKNLVKLYIELLLSRGFLDGLRVLSPIKDMDNIEFVEQDELLTQASQNTEETVIILNDFALPQSTDWSHLLVGSLSQEHVHMVSPLVARSDNTIEDCGLVQNGSELSSLFRGHKLATNTYFGDTDWTRNVDVLSGGIVAVRKSQVRELANKNMNNIRRLLKEYSSKAPTGTYNVILSDPQLIHVRSSLVTGTSKFMNINLQKIGSEYHLHPTDQQILDALLALKGGE
jgi:glycosyltransferase involved in cell wall biosynthesis